MAKPTSPTLLHRPRWTRSARIAALLRLSKIALLGGLVGASLAVAAQSYGNRAPVFAPSAAPSASSNAPAIDASAPGYGAGTTLPMPQTKAQVILIAPNDLATLPANQPFRIGFRTIGLSPGDHLQLLIDGELRDRLHRNVGTHRIRYGLPEGMHIITLRVVDAEGRALGHEQGIRLLMR